jgi:hypothetical protein
MLRRMESRSVGDIGGTPGGLGEFLLEWQKHGWLAINRGAGALHLRGHPRKYARLFSAHQLVQHSGHADFAGRWISADCAFHSATPCRRESLGE